MTVDGHTRAKMSENYLKRGRALASGAGRNLRAEGHGLVKFRTSVSGTGHLVEQRPDIIEQQILGWSG